jgi:DNA-binding MarR family transcriptional regulator
MNKTVELVTAWAQFEEQHAGSTIPDFCRYYLATHATDSPGPQKKQLAGGVIPAASSSLLMKIMARLVNVFTLYHRAAMDKVGLPFTDGYFYLHGLKNLGEVKKTDLINYLLAEYTTGMTYIDRLLEAGLVAERAGESDKRTKLIRLTGKGEELLIRCYKYAGKPGEMIFAGLPEEDIKLCIQLLAEIEIQHSAYVTRNKGKDFEEMVEELLPLRP